MSPDALSGFHPAVAGWFRSRFPAPTEAQARAWAVTSEHRHALIAAPTGSGKTLAAFLAATTFASWLPARRAAEVDPVRVLGES